MKRTPTDIPHARPMRPKMALASPPARRSSALQGQPRKTSAPTMAKNPSMKRITGAEPTLARHSPKRNAAIMAPKTKPMISGRIHCTTEARCIPIAPAISRSKQATQMPIFFGLPSFCRVEARMPITRPTETIPKRDLKKALIRSNMTPLSSNIQFSIMGD